MEVEFKRERNRNYMIIDPEPEGRGEYAAKMLERNTVAGLIPFRCRKTDGKSRYYYDITSRQPLNRLLEGRMAGEPEIRRLISDLIVTLRKLETFFLDENQLCLDPEFLYVEPDSFHCSLCLIPGAEKDFSEQFRGLIQYLLDHVDHGDSEAVMLAFRIFRQSQKMNFGIEDIETCLRREKPKNDTGWTTGEENRVALSIREPASEPSGCREYAEQRSEREPWPESRPEQRSEQRQESWSEPQGVKPRSIKPCPVRIGTAGTKIRWVATAVLSGLAVSAALAAVMGISALLEYKWILIALEILLVTGAALFAGTGKALQTEDAEEEDREEWGLRFREAGWEDGSESIRYGAWEDLTVGTGDGAGEKTDPDDEIQTILLTPGSDDTPEYSLISLDGDGEIGLPYFPFIIGKNKSLSDCCLDEPGISRLHLKISKSDDCCYVTDLNSTNGTAVNGRRLETNETCPIFVGDELMISTKKYRFRQN